MLRTVLVAMLAAAALPACGHGDRDATGERVAQAGLVTAVTGIATAVGPKGGTPRQLKVTDTVASDDTITTGGDGSIEVKLARNLAMLRVGASQTVRLDTSVAWSLPERGSDAGSSDVGAQDRLASAGRAAEHEAAQTMGPPAPAATPPSAGGDLPPSADNSPTPAMPARITSQRASPSASPPPPPPPPPPPSMQPAEQAPHGDVDGLRDVPGGARTGQAPPSPAHKAAQLDGDVPAPSNAPIVPVAEDSKKGEHAAPSLAPLAVSAAQAADLRTCFRTNPAHAELVLVVGADGLIAQVSRPAVALFVEEQRCLARKVTVGGWSLHAGRFAMSW